MHWQRLARTSQAQSAQLTCDALCFSCFFTFVPVISPQGLEAILRVRCSGGLDVEGYLGSFYKPPNSPTDVYLPAIDCDKALIAKLNIMEKLNPSNEARC
jgi:hypothetical protein